MEYRGFQIEETPKGKFSISPILYRIIEGERYNHLPSLTLEGVCNRIDEFFQSDCLHIKCDF